MVEEEWNVVVVLGTFFASHFVVQIGIDWWDYTIRLELVILLI